MPDFLSFAVPFIFVFAIVYGALELTAVFKENKKVGGLIALALSFFALSSEPVVAVINQFLPYAAMFFIVVFFIGFILAPFRGKEEKKDYGLIIIVCGLVAVFLINQGYELVSSFLPAGLMIGSENFMVIAGLALIIALFFAAYKKGKEG